MEKIYEVEFMKYQYNRAIISNETMTFSIIVGQQPFLIRESEFEKYMKFGGGFRIVKFVGNINIDETNHN